MTYRELLPDRFFFGRDTYGEDSYPLREGLPELLAELEAGTRTGADADLHFILSLLAFAHLGYPCSFDTRRVLNLGVDLIVHFIRGEWVKARPELAPTIDKRPDNPELEWFDAYRQGFLVALLSDRNAELRELADWPESWMETDPCLLPGLRVDPLYGKLYLAVAHEFRNTPFSDIEELRSKLRMTQKKELQLLHGAWEAVLARDQAAFEQGMVEAVLEWERAYDGNCAHPKNCIAEDASMILAAGRRLGMQMPEFEPRIAARLLTRESIRLDASPAIPEYYESPSAASVAQHPLKKLLQDFGVIDRDD